MVWVVLPRLAEDGANAVAEPDDRFPLVEFTIVLCLAKLSTEEVVYCSSWPVRAALAKKPIPTGSSSPLATSIMQMWRLIHSNARGKNTLDHVYIRVVASNYTTADASLAQNATLTLLTHISCRRFRQSNKLYLRSMLRLQIWSTKKQPGSRQTHRLFILFYSPVH